VSVPSISIEIGGDFIQLGDKRHDGNALIVTKVVADVGIRHDGSPPENWRPGRLRRGTEGGKAFLLSPL
jgi:hypothetical protein